MIDKLYKEWRGQQISDNADVEDFIQQIGKEIDAHCREHVTTDGFRFYGISWAEITRILQKYGFTDEIPF